MNIITALNDLFRYNAPSDSVNSIVQQAYEGGPVHHTNIGDGVLADYLADHDDPREEIVRRHLERTKRPSVEPYFNDHQTVTEEMEARLGAISDRWNPEYHNVSIPGGILHFHTYKDQADEDRRMSIVSWGHSLPARRIRNYQAVFTPEEAAHLMSRLKPVSEGLPVPID